MRIWARSVRVTTWKRTIPTKAHRRGPLGRMIHLSPWSNSPKLRKTSSSSCSTARCGRTVSIGPDIATFCGRAYGIEVWHTSYGKPTFCGLWRTTLWQCAKTHILLVMVLKLKAFVILKCFCCCTKMFWQVLISMIFLNLNVLPSMCFSRGKEHLNIGGKK